MQDKVLMMLLGCTMAHKEHQSLYDDHNMEQLYSDMAQFDFQDEYQYDDADIMDLVQVDT